ncbi:MAG: hypothetical protein GC134_08480 [Proteobacteria bacterium]|nr:hypothetical protein [Pseudomonadota bacterium]
MEQAVDSPQSLIVYALILLAAAVVVVTLFRRLRLSPVLGYLGAGMAIGPYGLQLVNDAESLAHFSEIGIVFLLFTIGLELSFERLNALKRYMLGLGSIQVVVTSAVFTGVAILCGLPFESALVAGSALSLSSTAFVLQLFMERGEQTTRHGRVGISVLLMQDLAVVPMLTLVPILKSGGGNVGMLVAQAMGIALIAMTAMILLGRLIMRPLYRWVASSRNQEVFIAMTLLVALGAGWLTSHFGLSMALGAFLAGMLLSETEFRHQVESDIRPFRGLLLGLFFMSVGMMMEVPLLFENLWLIIALLLVVVTVKCIILTIAARAFNLTWGVAVRVGLLLAQGGEFAFIIFGVAAKAGLMDEHIRQLLLLVVTLSMVVTPLLAYLAGRLASRIDRSQTVMDLGRVREETEHLNQHVLIAGFGRVGQTIAHMLDMKHIKYVALENDPMLVQRAQAFYSHVYFGDATRESILEAAGTERASIAVVTLNNPIAAAHTVAALRKHFPRLHIAARAYDNTHAAALREAGADTIVPETIEASLILGKLVLRSSGADYESCQMLTDEIRATGYRFLDMLVTGQEEDEHHPPAPSQGKTRKPKKVVRKA